MSRKELRLPPFSDIAKAAADALGSPCVVVLSMNVETDAFETRCFGASEAFRFAAGHMSNIAIEAVNATPPEDVDAVLELLSTEEDGGQPKRPASFQA